MRIIISILILLFSIRTLSYGIWCLKYDRKNILGAVSVIFLAVAVFSLCFFTGEIHG